MAGSPHGLSNGLGGYSARVRVRVKVDGLTHVVSAVGGGQLHFAEPTHLPSGRAELFVEVDGRAHAWDIELRGSGEQMDGCHDRSARCPGNHSERADSAKARFSFVTA